MIARGLAEIFASPEFTRAPVMRHLLSFLVDETLAGRGDRLKAYSVAVDALGRSADFDPQTDSYPRVQVGRLRKMLDAFYAGAPDTALRLAIPLGGYRVTFHRADPGEVEAPSVASPPRRRRWSGKAALITAVVAVGIVAIAGVLYLYERATVTPAATAVVPPPTLAVEIGDTATTRGGRIRLAEVGRALSAPLARSWLVSVVTGAATINSRYALLLDLDADETQASLRLVDRSDGRLLWSEQIAMPAGQVTATQAVAAQVSALIRPSGVIGAHQRGELAGSVAPGYPCQLRYDDYFRTRRPADAAIVKACIGRTLQLRSDNAPALAAASFLMFDPLAGGGGERQRRAAVFAQRAIDVAPSAPLAILAVTRVTLVGGNCARGTQEADRAVALGRHDPETLALVGLLLVPCSPAHGRELLIEARALDPALSPFFASALIVADLAAGDRASAVEHGRTLRMPTAGMRPQYLIAQTLSAIAAGDNARARQHWREVLALTPTSRGDVTSVLARYYFAPGLRAMITAQVADGGLTEAGPRT